MRLATRCISVALLVLAAFPALANVIVEWNQVASRTLADAAVAGNARARAIAMANAAMHDAVLIAEGGGKPLVSRQKAEPGASPVAAAAAAAHAVLARVAPSQKAKLDGALSATLATVADEKARAGGAAVGARVGEDVWADRQDDALNAPDDYRPHTTAGVWVPTAAPLFPEYARAKLWGPSSNSHYRPGPPPRLDSAQWARDYNEVKELGGRNSKTRTPAQTDAVRFWTQPALGTAPDQVARQLVEARQPGLADTARFYAHLQLAVANTFMADWDAKFHYNFWRPVTAIRNGDRDGNDATDREATWVPLNATPMHPEYPSQAGMIAAVLQAVVERHFGAAAGPLHMVEPGEGKLKRSFPDIATMAREMADVRIWGGVHFRTSLDASAEMGRRIAADVGAMVAAR